MADLTRDVNEEIGEGRDSLLLASPTYVFDATTWLAKRIPAIRNTAAATNLQDTNQALDQVLPD